MAATLSEAALSASVLAGSTVLIHDLARPLTTFDELLAGSSVLICAAVLAMDSMVALGAGAAHRTVG